MLVPLQDATAGCCCQSGVCALGRTPAQWRVRFGAGMLVLLQISLQGRCKVLLEGAVLSERCVRFGAGMLMPLQGVAVRVNCELSNLWSRHT